VFNLKVNMIQNFTQANFVRCQRFIYNYNNVPVVMIGSSMSAKIEQEILPDWMYNLSFAGGGALTGLEILLRSNSCPRLVLIETNLIDSEKDIYLLKNLYKPILWHIRKKMVSLQLEYQPLNLLMSFLKENIGKEYEAEIKNRKIDQDIVKSMLSIAKTRYSHIPDMGQKMEEIVNLTQELKNKGSIIVFYEMPIHPELTNIPRMKYIRSTVKKVVDENNYLYLPLPDNSQFETVDSIHMTYNSINKYLAILLKDIERINANRN